MRAGLMSVLGMAMAVGWGMEAPVRGAAWLPERGGVRLGLTPEGGILLEDAVPPGVPGLFGPVGEAWAVHFADGTEVTGGAFRDAPWLGSITIEEGDGAVVQRCEGPDLALEVLAAAQPDGVALRVRVLRTSREIARVDVPRALRFRPQGLTAMSVPQSAGQGTGLWLSGRFFAPHPDGSGGYESRALGPRGHALLFGGPLQQRADDEAPVALRVTELGREWLGADLVRRVENTVWRVNRPPAAGQMPQVWVDSENGPVLAASDLGGKGLLLRCAATTGGRQRDAEARLQCALVVGVTEALVRRRAEACAGRRVGIVALARGPEYGGWTAASVAEWLQAFRASRVLRQGGVEVTEVTTPEALRRALRDPGFAMILNPYGESLPTGDVSRWEEDLSAVAEFVRGGGAWWEVGGYPFFYVLAPRPYLAHRVGYPPASADFVHLQGPTASLALSCPQPLLRQPWDRERLVVPTQIECWGDDGGGVICHGWHVAIAAGGTWESPRVVLRPGVAVREALSAYAEAIGLRTALARKMRPETLRRLEGAVLVRLGGGTAAEQIEALPLLPAGSLVHFAEYLHGGFDKQYPDHLPPRVGWGTEADLREFYRRGQELGHLMMPYTNTSWWCIDPKGPTFEREGDEPLSRRRDGSFFKERYARNEGYRVCFWHPAVQEAHRRTRRQFSEQYPSDVLLQDQVGARGWSWDFHPAAPTPTAWIDGLHSLSMEDAALVPLATEDGYDRVAEFESMLCGMAWSIVPSRGEREPQRLAHRWPAGEWAVFPMMGYLAHDKAVFALHDLGHFVTDTEVLATVLGLGYSLSMRTSLGELRRGPAVEWLCWLDALQKSVCARYTGLPLTSFAYTGGADTEIGGPVMLAGYPGLRLAANTATAPFPATQLGEELSWAAPGEMGVDIAGPGFVAAGPGLRAGVVQARGGGPVYGFVVDEGAEATQVAVRAACGQEVLLPITVPAAGRARLVGRNGVEIPARLEPGAGGTSLLALPAFYPGEPDTDLPPQRVAAAPSGWPGWGRTVVVLEMGGDAPTTWVRMTAADWLGVLGADEGLRRAGLTVQGVATAAQLMELLRAAPGERPFAVVNPGGETFYAPSAEAAETMLDGIAAYVAGGGIWWETGGYSFYSCAYRDAGGAWQRRALGPAGASRLGFACAGFEVEAPAEPLVLTATGREWFGEEMSALLARSAAGVQRGFDPDDRVLILVRGASGDFVGGTRGAGWGWLWRLGGFNPDPALAGVVVPAVLTRLYTHAWPAVPSRTEPRFWRLIAPGIR
ncbi:MAG: hypothetical protein JXR77_08600 [Lentisphaeria bacterium]|nr:hypothetical protein [Lentisphaeria bacterium]